MTVATTAEFARGAGKPFDSLLGVFWGTGVGGGLILDGKPWLGRGGAGEIGHMVVELDGARCQCGRRGCMEAYAGRGAMEIRARELAEKGHETELFELMEKRGRTRLTSGIWARALKRSDPLAEKLVDRAIAPLGAGVASAVNLLDVEAIVIGGGLGDRLGQPYAERIAAAMLPHLFADTRPPAGARDHARRSRRSAGRGDACRVSVRRVAVAFGPRSAMPTGDLHFPCSDRDRYTRAVPQAATASRSCSSTASRGRGTSGSRSQGSSVDRYEVIAPDAPRPRRRT